MSAEHTPFTGPFVGPYVEIVETLRLVDGYVAAEMALFEALGTWATTVPEAGLRPFLAAQAQQHAWHAQLWRERRPVIPEPGNGAPPLLPAGLLTAPEPATTVDRLAGAYRVAVPRLVTAYAAHLRRIDENTDGSTARVLVLVLRDERESWVEGEAVLQGLLTSDAEVESAGRQVIALEQAVQRGNTPGR